MITLKNNNVQDNNVERVRTNVKWYNPIKGYGFLYRDDNTRDIMIHFSLLNKVGCPYIKLGDVVTCDVASGKFGDQVTNVIEIKYGSPEPRSLSSFMHPRIIPADLENLAEIEGSIKWYNPIKGYGFIHPDDGGQEIFIHCFVLRAAGYQFLQPDVRVLVKVSYSERGPEARMLRVLHKDVERKEESA